MYLSFKVFLERFFSLQCRIEEKYSRDLYPIKSPLRTSKTTKGCFEKVKSSGPCRLEVKDISV